MTSKFKDLNCCSRNKETTTPIKEVQETSSDQSRPDPFNLGGPKLINSSGPTVINSSSSNSTGGGMCSGLSGCCCCFSLRSGSLMAGSIFLAMSSVNIASVVLNNFEIDIHPEVCYNRGNLVIPEHCFQIRKYATSAMLIAALMDCIHGFTCLLLFFGIFRRSEVMMLPFMAMTVLQALRMIVITILSVAVHYVLRLSMVILINSSVIHLAIVVYLGAVVYNYYPKIMKSMFRDWYNEMKKRRDQNTIDPKMNVPIAWIDFESAGLKRSDSYLTLEMAKDEELSKVCKDTLCIIVPFAIVVAAWAGKEFFLYMYI